MAPWLSAPHTSRGTSCSSWDASSERRRMNPTWGPFPWPMATFHPSLIIDAMCQQVSPAAMYWSRTVWCSRSLISEFPPMATTAVLPPTPASLLRRAEHHGEQRHPHDHAVEGLDPVPGVAGAVDVLRQLVHPGERVQHDGVALGPVVKELPGHPIRLGGPSHLRASLFPRGRVVGLHHRLHVDDVGLGDDLVHAVGHLVLHAA